jgi:hypothetical protein
MSSSNNERGGVDALRALSSAFAVVGALAMAGALSMRTLSDFGLPYHLAFGRLVVLRRSLVRVDELACTRGPIGLAEYVGDLGLYAVEACFGPLGLQVLGGALAVTIAVLLWRASRGAGPFGWVMVAIALASMQAWLLVRPATISFALIALVLFAIARHRDAAEAGVASARHRPYWLVPVFALWANVHGFVVLGLVLVWGYAVYAGACRLLEGRLGDFAPLAHGDDAGALAFFAVLCTLASFLNIAGPLLLVAPFAASHDYGWISEWAPTTLSFITQEAPLAGIVALAAAFALALGREPGGGRRPTLFDVGLTVVAFVLARTAVRMVPVMVLFVTPLAARRLGSLFPRRRWQPLAASVATWCVAPWMIATSHVETGIGFSPSHFSEGAIRFIRTARPEGQMYNSVPLGGFLEWSLFPSYRAFIDGRRTGLVHDPALVAIYHASESDPSAFADLLSRFDFQWAVVFAAEGSPYGVTVARSSDWAMVYWDDASAIYVRVRGPNAALARQGYHLLRHQTDPSDVFRSSLARDRAAKELAQDAHLAESQAPSSARAAFLAGCGAIAEGDRTGLEAAISKLERLSPGHPGIALLRGGWDAAEARDGTP